MPLTYKVPKNVRAAAENALRAHAKRPGGSEAVSGAGIATALKEGTVGLDLVASLHRFFTINERLYRAAIRTLQDDLTAPVILSWRLHGDTGGKVWARRVFTQAVKEGLLEEDQYAALFRREPEQIYDLFAADAWRWEYGLDPRSAARFVEEYAHQTGNLLEINRAFGDGAKAVGNAVYRRYHTPNPFEEVYKAMVVEDVDYKLAAELDLHDMCRSANIPLSESLFPQIANKSDLTVAKTIWGQFVAYFILAVEAPDLLKPVHKGSKIPPLLMQTPKKHFAYPDPINTYIRYFHPDGAKYVDPNKDKKFVGLEVEAENLMKRAFYGKKITRVQALKFLGRARRWTAKNKMAGSLFHIFNADWKKANWQHILDNIPLEADVQPAFAAFVAGNPMPAEGVDLQQTLAKKATKVGVIKALSIQYGDMPTAIEPMKLRDTDSGKWAKGEKTPLGVYSVLLSAGTDHKFIMLGAYKVPSQNEPILVYHPEFDEANLKLTGDAKLLDALKKKSVIIVQGHKDMPGTIYGAPEKPKKEDQAPGAAEDEDALLAFIASELELPVDEVKAISLTLTESWATFGYEYPEWMFIETTDLDYKKEGTEFSLKLLGAFETAVQMVIAYRDDDGDLGWTDDDEFSQAITKHYVRPQGWEPNVPEDPAFPDWVPKELGKMFGVGAANVSQVPLSSTKFAKACKIESLECKSYSQWVYCGPTYQLIGAAQIGGVVHIVFQDIIDPNDLIGPMDSMASQSVYDGTAYPSDKKQALPDDLHKFTDEEYSAIKNQYNLEEPDVLSVPLETTDSYDTAKENGWGFRRGTVWGVKTAGGAWLYYKVSGAFKKGFEVMFLLYKGEDQNSTTDIAFFYDSVFKGGLNNGDIIPAAQVPVTSPPKFVVGDVLDFPSARWAVLGFQSQQYLLQPLNVSYDIKATTTGFQDVVEGAAEKVGHIDEPLAGALLTAHIVLPSGWEHMPKAEFVEETGLALGTAVNMGGSNYWISGGVKNTAGETYVLGTRPATSKNSGWSDIAYIEPLLSPASDYITEYESTYEPTDPKPEPGAEDALDAVDDEAGNAAMSGTNPAFTFLKKKDWTPAVKSESPEFQWDLGAKLQYGPEKTRTIIGYGFADEAAIYVMVTEKGNVNFKSVKVGNQQYGPVIEYVQNIVDNLHPKPSDAGKQKFPKLNYGLSSHAKKLAQKHDLIYISSPANAPFYVGSKIYDSVEGKSGWLVAWTGDPEEHEFNGIIMYKDGTWSEQSFNAILNNLSIKYANTNVIDETEGDITFGKGSENVSMTVNYPGGSLPTKPVEGWDDPTPVQQPAFPELPSGKHISAGVVAVFPATSTGVNSGPTIAVLPKATFVMTHPMNEFAGYSITFPKGTVEPGESIEKAAVRECFEETGLTMKLVAFLGDYKGQSSLTRMFMGYVTGGDPKAAGKETDAVSLKPFDFAAPPSEQKWWSQLQDRDKKIVDDAIDWMNTNGLPNEVKISEAAEDSAVTGPQDTEGSNGPDTYDPKAEHEYKQEFPKQLISTADYKVTVDTKKWCGSFFGTVYYEQWWYGKQLEWINLGYPPVGALIKAPDAQVPVSRVRAYVDTKEKDEGGEYFGTYIVVEYEDKTTHWALLINSGQAGATPYKPEVFQPVVSKTSVKPTAITADTTKDDVWKTLLFKAPFPVSQEMQDALKKTAAAIPSIPATFSCAKNMTKGPPYGEIVVYPALDSDVPYLVAGYVEWKDTEGNDYSFALLVGGGKVQVIPSLNFITDEWSIDANAKAAQSPADPFFTHPDPNINAVIQQIYANGGDTKAVGTTVGQFKDQWMKEAKLPAYAVVTKPLLQDVASLFVPGAATQAQYDAIVGCLKARMKATHKNKGKKGTSAGTAVATPQITAAAPVLPEVNVPKKVLKAKGLNVESAVYQNYVNTPQPMLFSDLGQTVGGGSKPNKLLAGPGGTKWFFKMGPGKETFRPYVDRAAYLISDLVKDNNIPVGVMEFEGGVGSYQPYAEDATNPPSDPTTLSPENMAEVLAQHMVDMFMGDHDGHVGNWLRIGTQLRAVDRGQAFKFLFQNKNDSYDPTWHAKGNFGEGYAKKLLIEWGNNNVDLPKESLQGARDAIAKVQAIVDQQLEAILTPVFDARDTSPAERKKILKKLYTRRDNYLKDWTAVMKGLKKGFKWPSVGVTIPKITPLKSSPKTQEFKAREEKTIKEAVAAGWQGKALQIDKDAIENQEVMVRRVTYEEKPGMKIPATLIQFRVAREAGLKLVQTLAPKAKVTIEEGGTAFGPQRLKADVVKNYYEAILAAIKSVNHHLSKEKNLEINMDQHADGWQCAQPIAGIGEDFQPDQGPGWHLQSNWRTERRRERDG